MSRTKSLWNLFSDAEGVSDCTTPSHLPTQKGGICFSEKSLQMLDQGTSLWQGWGGFMALQGSQRVKSCCSFSHSSCSAFVSPLIQQSSKLYCLYGQREGRALHCDRCYWAQRNICMDLLNSGWFSASEQRKKNKKNNQTTSSLLSFLQLFISKLFFPTGWPQGSFILLPDLGLLPAVCSFPKCLWGFFCCHYPSMAACQLPEALSFLVTTLCWLHALCLAKLDLLVKMRHVNLFSMLGNQSFPFAVNT